MNPLRQIELIERGLAHVDSRTTDVGSSARLPASDYTSPDELEHERQGVLSQCPVVVGDASQVRAPGEYVTHQLADTNVAVVRDADGELRGFVNVCRHRGSLVLRERSGKEGAFRCPYHGWTYSLAGQLMHVPHASGFPTLQCSATRLPEVGVSDAHGLLWARPAADAGPLRIETFVGAELGAELDALRLAEHAAYEQRWSDARCNWKLIVDGGLEAYHFRTTHRATVYPYFLDNVALVDSFGAHQRIVLFKRSLAECRSLAREKWRLLDHANVVYFLFPNTFLLVQKDRVTRVSSYPMAVDRTSVVVSTLLRRVPENDKELGFVAESSRLVHAALCEDQQAAESVFAGLLAGLDAVTFGNFEHALTRFHDELASFRASARTCA